MTKVIYSNLSFQIIGAIFEVYNKLKYGHKEKIYQKALAEELNNRGLKFEKEIYFPIRYKGKLISCYYYDFLVENKIILELKVAEDFYQKDVNQLLAYLKFRGFKLGILALFTKKGVLQRRILN